MLVTLACPRSGPAVIEPQTALRREDKGQCLEVDCLQRRTLLCKGAPGQHQMMQGHGKLVQNGRVMLTNRTDPQGRIGIQERIEARITRTTGQRHRLLACGILGSQPGNPADDEPQSLVLDHDLFRLDRLQIP